MRLLLFYVGMIGFGLGVSAQEALQVDAHLSGGINWSHGTSGKYIRQMPFLTYYAQVGLGYWVSSRLGIGMGVVHYPIGILHGLKIDDNEVQHNSSLNVSRSYPHLLQFDMRYHIPLSDKWVSGSQLGLGVMTGKWHQSALWVHRSDEVYDNLQIMTEWAETELVEGRFWALVGRWNYPVWHKGRQQVFLALQVIKGLTPVGQTMRGYFINDPNLVVRGDWTTYGDFVGVGITYQWTYWHRKLKY